MTVRCGAVVEHRPRQRVAYVKGGLGIRGVRWVHACRLGHSVHSEEREINGYIPVRVSVYRKTIQ